MMISSSGSTNGSTNGNGSSGHETQAGMALARVAGHKRSRSDMSVGSVATSKGHSSEVVQPTAAAAAAAAASQSQSQAMMTTTSSSSSTTTTSQALNGDALETRLNELSEQTLELTKHSNFKAVCQVLHECKAENAFQAVAPTQFVNGYEVHEQRMFDASAVGPPMLSATQFGACFKGEDDGVAHKYERYRTLYERLDAVCARRLAQQRALVVTVRLLRPMLQHEDLLRVHHVHEVFMRAKCRLLLQFVPPQCVEAQRANATLNALDLAMMTNRNPVAPKATALQLQQLQQRRQHLDRLSADERKRNGSASGRSSTLSIDVNAGPDPTNAAAAAMLSGSASLASSSGRRSLSAEQFSPTLQLRQLMYLNAHLNNQPLVSGVLPGTSGGPAGSSTTPKHHQSTLAHSFSTALSNGVLDRESPISSASTPTNRGNNMPTSSSMSHWDSSLPDSLVGGADLNVDSTTTTTTTTNSSSNSNNHLNIGDTGGTGGGDSSNIGNNSNGSMNIGNLSGLLANQQPWDMLFGQLPSAMDLSHLVSSATDPSTAAMLGSPGGVGDTSQQLTNLYGGQVPPSSAPGQPSSSLMMPTPSQLAAAAVAAAAASVTGATNTQNLLQMQQQLQQQQLQQFQQQQQQQQQHHQHDKLSKKKRKSKKHSRNSSSSVASSSGAPSLASSGNVNASTSSSATAGTPSTQKRTKKKRGLLPKAAVAHMKKWLFDHFDHPYPTDLQKQQLGKETGLQVAQVNYWFINARVRIWRPMLKQMRKQGGPDFLRK
eukprot:TRINITY_DN67068_c2_g4_i1.p1 TRINITY_DN67068_c2_g4~~TRINITY_DN67068_c2_g4_i1.p1  ORF type:complete len:771 (+),score=391.62 TRINITY_DN67068_c2_g4_i1:70-2382(+)